MNAVQAAVNRLDIESYDSTTWDLTTTVVGADGWQAVKLLVSGKPRPGQPIRGDLIASQTIAAVAHGVTGGLDELRLHGLPGVDSGVASDATPAGMARKDGSAVGSFLAAYAAADAHGMVRACRPDARYQGPWPGPGFRASRVTTGYVATDGKPKWRALFDAFADFRLTVNRFITAADHASAAAEVVMSGRQVTPWLGIGNFGQSGITTGVIFFETGDDGRITSIDEVLDLERLESQLLALAGA